MDRSEAHEHLAMVDRILENSANRPFRPIGSMLIVWGLATAAVDAGEQVFLSTGSVLFARAGLVAIVLAILFTVCVEIAIRRNSGGLPAAEKRMVRAIYAVWLCVLCAAFSAPNVFAGWSAGGIWSLGAAITLFMSGLSGDRPSLVGGIVIAASMIVANFATPHAPGYTLAAGMLLGYAVPGVILAVRGARGDE